MYTKCLIMDAAAATAVVVGVTGAVHNFCFHKKSFILRIDSLEQCVMSVCCDSYNIFLCFSTNCFSNCL